LLKTKKYTKPVNTISKVKNSMGSLMN